MFLALYEDEDDIDPVTGVLVSRSFINTPKCFMSVLCQRTEVLSIVKDPFFFFSRVLNI